ncbi:dockerin type I domain-containing protein [Roseiconus nitratireducens]|nr:dockerin type I domain-containing protein [Roseiconus nitratireducens]
MPLSANLGWDLDDAPVIQGTDANDTIVVRKSDDPSLGIEVRVNDAAPRHLPASPWIAIHALQGNDTIVVEGDQNVFIDAGDGDDVVVTSAGHDLVLGGQGNDFLDGGGGNDYLMGGAGDDRLFGRDGGDTLYGDDHSVSAGNDFLNGGNGDDRIIAGGGADTLWGEAGDDILESSRGRNGCNTQSLPRLDKNGQWASISTLKGCLGTDADGSPDMVDGGSGIDSALLSLEEGDLLFAVESIVEPIAPIPVRPVVPDTDRFDVNDDGLINGADAEWIIDHLHTRNGSPTDVSKYDVSGDGRVTILDALRIINRHDASLRQSEGHEGELLSLAQEPQATAISQILSDWRKNR